MTPCLHDLADLHPREPRDWDAAIPVLTAHALQLLEVGVVISLDWWARQTIWERAAMVRAARRLAVDRARLRVDAGGDDLARLRAEAYVEPQAAALHDLEALSRVVADHGR